jgi:hypothetical protein
MRAHGFRELPQETARQEALWRIGEAGGCRSITVLLWGAAWCHGLARLNKLTVSS